MRRPTAAEYTGHDAALTGDRKSQGDLVGEMSSLCIATNVDNKDETAHENEPRLAVPSWVR